MITKKTKVVGISSALFFLAACAGMFFLGQYVQNEGEKLVKQTKEVEDFNMREQSYRELSNLIDSTQEDRSELNKYILTEEKTIDFLSTIEQIAIDQGVELTTNSLHISEETGMFDALTISFSVAGLQQQVETMLQIFETLPYHAFVSDITFQYSKTEGVKMLRGTIELTVSILQHDR